MSMHHSQMSGPTLLQAIEWVLPIIIIVDEGHWSNIIWL